MFYGTANVVDTVSVCNPTFVMAVTVAKTVYEPAPA